MPRAPDSTVRRGTRCAHEHTGKPWEVAHDLWSTECAEGVLPPVAELPEGLGAPFCARFDRIWHTAEGLRATAVLAPRSEAEESANEPLPNGWSASDHLLVGATLELS